MNKLLLTFSFILVITTVVFSQGPVLELRTESVSNNETITIHSNFRPRGAALDVNGDGVRDLIVSPRDPATGQATGIVVKSGNSNQTWEYPFESFSLNFEEVKQTFLGFYEMNNSSPEKEAIFARRSGRSFIDPIILNQEASFNIHFNDILISSISDIDDDGIDELQLYNKQTGELEIWGPGPKLELFPQSFSLDNITIDVFNKIIIYNTQVNNQKRDVNYKFLENNTVDVSIKDEIGNILLIYNSSQDFWSIPEVDDEVLVWLVTQNLIKNPTIGLAEIWSDYKDSFSNEAQQYASNGLGGIGGIIGLIPAIADIFCRASGTASCTDDDGVTTTINCTCGVPNCQTKQVAVTVMIVEVDPNTGSQTTRQEIQYKDKCFCTCLKLKETRE
ncbi:MAG: hypothetical protein HXY50_11855 [Ignavibacteriaceae bacterium]|nr:hypothetical protein [Ignavibacteriaceae bacterium]